MKKCVSYLILVAVFTMMVSTQAESIPVAAYKIKGISEKQSWITGLIKPISQQKLSCYADRSLILEIMPVGMEFEGNMIDSKGGIIQEGQAIVKIAKNRFENELKIRESELKSSLAKLNNVKLDYDRKSKLIEKHVGSQADFEDTISDYQMAYANVIEAQNNVDLAKLDLAHADIKAPFNGIVTKHFWSPGATKNKGDEIVEVMGIDYMLVEIDTSNDIARLMDPTFEYDVYPKLSKECSKAYFPNVILGEKTFLIVKNNKIPVIAPLSTQKKLPKINRMFMIVEFGGKLWAPIRSVHTDSKGAYVYECEAANAEKQPNSHEFILKKTYLKANKDKKYSGNIVEFVLIENAPNNIRNGTKVLTMPDDVDYEDGTMVFLQPERYSFIPGDQVHIFISGMTNTENSYYVPSIAICADNGHSYVYKIVNGKAVKTEINEIRSAGCYTEVQSPNLAAGDQIAISKGQIKEGDYLSTIELLATPGCIN